MQSQLIQESVPSPRRRAPSEGDEDPTKRATWFRALDLAERIDSLRRAGASEAGDGASDPELASRRLRHWRDRPPLDDDATWRRRAALAGASEEELLAIAGEGPEALLARSDGPPAWLDEIARAYATPVAEPFPWPDGATARERAPFLPLAEPLVRAALEGLLGRLQRLVGGLPADPPFEPESAARALLAHLPEGLALPLNRLLVVELHAAKLEGRLAGDTPGERFESFRASLYRRDVALDVLARYPVFARSLVLRLEQWQESAFEVLQHLAEDAPELRRRFHGGRELGLLESADGGLSDPHHGGRTVFVLRFSGGRRIVYKPRPLAAEAAFQELLAWLNARGCDPAFRVLEVLDAGDHGWMEHVAPAPCQSPAEARRFFLRQGGFLALLHLLDGTDVHHENLIAAGEHPVIVDLETLFHPAVDGPSLRDTAQHPGAPLRDSVLASGLLPQRVWGSRDRAGVDLSALGSSPGQLTPQPVLAPTERHTDGMRFERRTMEIPLGEHRPHLRDRPLSVLDHAEDLEEGYARLFHLVVEHRDELGAPGGPLTAFAEAPVRIIFRPTAAYGSLLVEACHPHVASNALERERLFDRLWAGLASRPYLETLLPYELADLARGDVPRFVTRPGSRDVWTGNGERLPEVFDETGLERVRDRLARWGEPDLARQRSVIRGSLDVLRLSTGSPGRATYDFRPGAEPASEASLLAAARAAGRRLLDLAFRGPAEALWLMVDHGEPEGWRFAPTRPDFYLGLPGIALALGYLSELTGETEGREVARLALRSQSLQIEHEPERVSGLGILNGWGGVVYTLTHLGVLWRDAELLDEAESFLDRLAGQVEEDTLLDLGTGSAGCLLGLLALGEHRPSDRLASLARRCGERLLETAVPQARGMGWVMPIAGDRPLAGISHGAAGIALALLRLAAATGDERFRVAARQGIELERALFSPEEGNWPDLRAWGPEGAEAGEAGPDPGAGERFMCAWCHGAPGVGLARVAGLPHLDDPAVREEIAIAVETTLAHGFGDNHSLCHGDLGNLDFLLSAARALDDRALLREVYRRAAGVLRSIEERGWLFGLPGNVETPGLMVGLAGVAYGLARLAAPDRLPSILALAHPGNRH